jgi:hypothetical protein
MSMLLDLQSEIQRTNEAVARAERAVANHPTLLSAQATLRGFVQLRDRLQEEFAAAAQEAGRDVCRYAIETEDPMPALRDIASVWGTFQRLFTIVYDVTVSGRPKQNESYSETVANAARFGFAYTFSGSVGVVLTVDQGSDLIPDTGLDAAMKNVFEIMSARRPEAVIDVNRRFGLAAVRIAREWAAENSRAHFGANVEWRGTDKSPQRFRIQTPEIIQLESAIDRATETRTDTIFGKLVDVNIEERSFQIRLDSETLISGTYTNAISPERPAIVPSRYRAEVEIRTRILQQETEASVEYFLLSLSPDG